MSPGIEPVYAAPTGVAAKERPIPFLDHDVEMRIIMFVANAIEYINIRYRRVTRDRGHLPGEQAALNAFAIALGGRITPTGN